MGPIKVENVIVASHLGKKLELVKLATEIPNARYSSSGNPSVIIEVDMSSSKFIGSKRLKAAGILFANGKLIVTGVNSLDEGKEVVTNLRNLIKPLDPKINLKRAIKLENMVAKTNISATIDLQALALIVPDAEYDPSRFSGLILRMDKPDASFILFESGVLIVTDIISLAKAKKALNELESFIAKNSIAS